VDSQRPSEPTGVTVSALTSTTVTLTWDPSTDDVAVSRYRVYVAIGTGFFLRGEPTATTFTVTGLTPGGTVEFFVQAVDTSGNASSFSAGLWVTTPADSATCSVHYAVVSQWQDGFVAFITMTNTGTTAVSNGWDLQFSFPSPGQQLLSGWNADFQQRGLDVVAHSLSYNAVVRPGESVSLGFIGAYATANPAPVAFRVDGGACAVV
jgi:hypothetical protein